jgi:hypothetical protein
MWHVMVIILSVSIAALAIGISRRGASGGFGQRLHDERNSKNPPPYMKG